MAIRHGWSSVARNAEHQEIPDSTWTPVEFDTIYGDALRIFSEPPFTEGVMIKRPAIVEVDLIWSPGGGTRNHRVGIGTGGLNEGIFIGTFLPIPDSYGEEPRSLQLMVWQDSGDVLDLDFAELRVIRV